MASVHECWGITNLIKSKFVVWAYKATGGELYLNEAPFYNM